jgi:hypothetical protein
MIYLNFIRDVVASAWGAQGMTDVLWNRYLNAYCIEINHLDDSFQLTPQVRCLFFCARGLRTWVG